MGVAGQRAEDRGLAHYKWAERYTKRGQIDKALAHFGRALDFGGVVFGDQPKDFESAFCICAGCCWRCTRCHDRTNLREEAEY
jgi:hypothetical protein